MTTSPTLAWCMLSVRLPCVCLFIPFSGPKMFQRFKLLILFRIFIFLIPCLSKKNPFLFHATPLPELGINVNASFYYFAPERNSRAWNKRAMHKSTNIIFIFSSKQTIFFSFFFCKPKKNHQRRKFAHQRTSRVGVTMANAFRWLGCAMATKIAPMDRTKRHAVSIAFGKIEMGIL